MARPYDDDDRREYNRATYRRPAPRQGTAYDLPVALVALALLVALAYVAYVRLWPTPAQPNYQPDPRPAVVLPAAPAPVYQPAPIPQAPIVVVQPAPADPAPVIPTPAPPPAVEPGQPTPPAQIVIIHRIDGQGGQVITGSGACAAARGARRCGR